MKDNNDFEDIDLEALKNALKHSTGVYKNSQTYFIQVPNSFMRNTELNLYEKGLYLYIWGYAGDKKGAYPSHQKMMKHLGISKSTVIRNLKTLEEKGGICMLNRIKKDTKEKSTNIYYLADIDINDGTFIKESIDIVKKLYPDKTIYI